MVWYSYEEIEDCEALHEDDSEFAISNAVISILQVIGIGKVTEDKLDEIYYRSVIAGARYGGFINDFTKAGRASTFNPSIDDFARRVGLMTNADPLTKPEFAKKMRDSIIAKGKEFTEQRYFTA